MKKIIAIALPVLFFAGLAFHSCKDPIAEEFTGDIVGIVSDKTTGEPIPTVNVSLEPGGVSTVTGSDGSYLFAELEIGSYTVSVTKQGYNPDSKVVDVEPGKTTNGDFLIERIPSVVTVDRDVLDFGEGSDVNSLSFNIVNSGYEDLEWKIEYDCDWIREIRDTSGTLAYGKTQAIVVFINRELLAPGENTTTLVVRSSNGSSDLTVKAVGAEREEVVLNTLEVEDITSSTATFYARIINAGVPKYTSRGFVYSTSSNPTEATAIKVLTAPVTDDSVFSARVSGLELNKKYYVRAFAKSELGTFYSTNEESFITIGTDPTLMVLDVSNINVKDLTATFNATVESIGDPEYISRGFVYDTSGSPTIYKKSLKAAGSGIGTYSADVKDLEFDKTYYVRAYVESKAGIFYSDNEVSFKTEGTDPAISVLEVSNINIKERSAVLNGNVENAGYPEYIEKGFVYSTLPNPDTSDFCVKGTGSGAGPYSVSIDCLEDDIVYFVKAYIKTANGKIIYSQEEVTFMLSAILPILTVSSVTDISISTMSVVLNANISEAGDPPYDERGFVYGLIPKPTINDNIQPVSGNGEGNFSIRVSGIESFKEYYVRAYAKVDTLVIYSSNQVTFTIESVVPEVSVQKVENINLTSRTAVLNGTVLNIGNPEYCERGFVYGKFSNPTLNDNVLISGGSGLGSYRSEVKELEINVKYYVRAYAASSADTVYSKNEVSFETTPELPTVSIQNVENINVAERSVIFNGTIQNAGNPSYSEKGFVYGLDQNPTIYDSKVMVQGTSSGLFSSQASGFMLDQLYYVRAYAINEAGVAYSNTNISFTISITPAKISVLPVIGMDYTARTAVLRGCVESAGNPTYTEKGFIYDTSNESPSLCKNQVIVKESETGEFSTLISDLRTDINYYVWAYSINGEQKFYSDNYEEFILSPIIPELEVQEVSNMDIANRSVTLNAVIINEGMPVYTERGFVYNTTSNPTINNSKVIVDGSGTGTYSTTISNISLDKKYYIRAYAINGNLNSATL